MRRRRAGLLVEMAVVGLVLLPCVARGQALPTATRDVGFTAFAGASERAPRLAGARNTDVVAGLDIGFLPVRGLLPALELRGSYPVVKGDVAGEQEFLGGLRLAKRLGGGDGRVAAYGNLLLGRGQITYYGAGLQVPGMNVFYTQSHSTIFSPGGGVEVGAGGKFAIKLDAQYERYGTPVTTSGSAWAAVATVGVVYRLEFEPRQK